MKLLKRLFSFIIVLFAVVFFIETSSAKIRPEVTSGTLTTKDNVAIAYEHFKNGFDTVVIICPGFYNSKKNRWMRKTVDLISSEHDVIIFDFRGHGQSGGKYTWSAREDMDVDAVIDYAKSKRYRRIGILGYSLGAASAINAVARRNDIDSMVLVSCPSSFRMINYHFWEPRMWDDLMDNIECGWEGKGARATHIFIHKTKPIDSIVSIEKTPILFIHGDKDWVLKTHHSQQLFERAKTPKKLEIVENGPHAERLIEKKPEIMENLILEWFRDTMNGN